jgi:hypothetical protein
MRDSREKAMRAGAMSAMRSGSIDGYFTRILDDLDDMDDAVTFFVQWKRGTLLDLEPGQKLDRWETTVRINQRMDRDPELYGELLRQPRYMAALMAQEAIGLPILSFLAQVKEVRFVEEEPGLHWLLLPECHRGCEGLEGPVEAPSHCTVCGRPQGAADSSSKSPNSLATTLERIHAVDDYVVRLARDSVMKDPTEAFAQASQTLFGARPEELFGIHKVHLAAESDTMLYTIRLADHEPKRTAVTGPDAVLRDGPPPGYRPADRQGFRSQDLG